MDLKSLAKALKSGDIPVSHELEKTLKDVKCATCAYRWRTPECGTWNLNTLECDPIVSIPNIYIFSKQTGMTVGAIITLIDIANSVLPKN